MNPCFGENIALPLLPNMKRKNSSEFEKKTHTHLVGIEFPTVGSLALNSDMSGSCLNTATIREGQTFVVQYWVEGKSHKVLTTSTKCKGGGRRRQGQVKSFTCHSWRRNSFMFRARRASAYTVHPEDVPYGGPRGPIILWTGSAVHCWM